MEINEETYIETYIARMTSMIEELKAWRERNPDLEVICHFRIPSDVWLAFSLQGAIENGFLVLDDNGRQMLSELGWMEDRADAPSAMMLMMVIKALELFKNMKEQHASKRNQV